MEPYSPSPTPASPFTSPQPHRSRSRTSLYIALVAGAIAAAISAYILWGGGGVLGIGSQKILLAPRSAPLFPAAVLDTGTRTITPLTVEGIGAGSVIGYAKGTDKDYYLVAEEGGTQSNVYASDPKDPKAGLSQVTFTPSLKTSLSYDGESGGLAFAYTVGASTSSRIAFLPAGTTTEVSLTEGTNPTLLKGGFFIAYEKDGNLMSVGTSQPKKYTLLTVPEEGSYAVDPESLSVAVYDPSFGSIQHYSVSSFTSASAQKAEPAPQGSHISLAFAGGRLVWLGSSDEGLFILNAKNEDLVAGSGAYANAALTAYEN